MNKVSSVLRQLCLILAFRTNQGMLGGVLDEIGKVHLVVGRPARLCFVGTKSCLAMLQGPEQECFQRRASQHRRTDPLLGVEVRPCRVHAILYPKPNVEIGYERQLRLRRRKFVGTSRQQSAHPRNRVLSADRLGPVGIVPDVPPSERCGKLAATALEFQIVLEREVDQPRGNVIE